MVWVGLTSIGVAREVTGPLDESAALKITRGDGEQADGRQNGSVRELGLGSDDTVGDVVVDGLDFGQYFI